MELDAELLRLTAGRQRSYGSPVLAIGVESDEPADRLNVRIREAIASLEGEEEVFWSSESATAGVIIRQWGYTPDVRETLRALASALSGVAGRLVAHHEQPIVPAAPLAERDEELLECHLRTFGERTLQTSGNQQWVRFMADQRALRAGIEAAIAWVGGPPAGARLWSTSGEHLDPDELRAYVAYGFARSGGSAFSVVPETWWWESEDAFRLARIAFASGDVSLVAGGPALAAGTWRPAYGALRDALSAAWNWASYGFIKRGRRVSQVGRSLSGDWVPRPDLGSVGLGHFAYEDVLAPDAFGVQLLGAGYAGRVPPGADWERVELAEDAVLLSHRDPAAWFARPLPPAAALLSGARADLAAILIDADVVVAGALDPLAAR